MQTNDKRSDVKYFIKQSPPTKAVLNYSGSRVSWLGEREEPPRFCSCVPSGEPGGGFE